MIPAEVAQAFGIEPFGRPIRLQRGTLNQNYRLETGEGQYFLRRRRAGVDSSWLEREWRTLDVAASAGIPMPEELRTREGERAAFADGAWWSLYRWVDGRQVVRGRISAADAAAMGDLLGRVHQALTSLPIPETPLFVTWDTSASAATLERVLLLATARRDAGIAEGIRERLRLLDSSLVRRPEEYRGLLQQVTHGDYHDRQVLFARGRAEVLALTDWEMTRVMPRVWEVVPCVVFSKLDNGNGLEAFGRGYRQHVQLPREEAEMAVDFWLQTRLHENWALIAYYEEGNRRVAPFIPSGFRHLEELLTPEYRSQVAAALSGSR